MRIGLKQIVAELIDSKDSSSHEFRRFYNIGVRGIREFNTDVSGNFSTKLIDVNANKTAELPCDYITYSKMGVINEKGEIVTLRSNPQLSNYNDGRILKEDRFEDVPSIGTISAPAIPYNYPYIYYNFFVSNQSFNLFGIGGGGQDVGQYKIDEECGIIILSPNFRYEKILLEYLGDGLDRETDDYMVDSRVSEALLAYMRWKSALDLPKKFPQSLVREYKQEYKSERLKAKMRINKIVVSEFEDIQRLTNKLAPRA